MEENEEEEMVAPRARGRNDNEPVTHLPLPFNRYSVDQIPAKTADYEPSFDKTKKNLVITQPFVTSTSAE